MKQIRIKVNKIIERFLVLILVGMVLNVIWQVFTRFFTSSPSAFTNELARYLMIWLGILGAAYISGKQEHVAIDFFVKKLNNSLRRFIDRFVLLSILSFAFFVMIIGGINLVYITLKLEQYSPSLQIPLALVYSIIPISGLLIIFYKVTQEKS
ncbi:MAG: TRAP transporter small permease [Flavobacteriaceae bacterium]|jgi:TRAP-type C4-dicarboxylate transport system permease small subunit|nr:TRAP transporter small permease [Flavobacteriaceae bacterium]MDG1686795.1 TRAP transporter small permease [Flavobacteriaceae bacterium]MDG2235882.1 TRAP transporter small permease [Flavobacteriaceae bacterium]|tara:strand:- start:5517 stop:5975 length:459 start_codon:yes stop_codon:yes gene_type:complete